MKKTPYHLDVSQVLLYSLNYSAHIDQIDSFPPYCLL